MRVVPRSRRAGAEEHHLGVFFLQLGDLLQGIHHSGGGFIVHEGDGVEFTGRELGVNGFRQDRGSPIDL